MPGRISPCPVTGCSSFSAIVEFRAPHLERGENTRAAVSTTINHSVFRSSLPTTILSLSLPFSSCFFFFLRFGQFSTEELGVIVRSRYEQQARQKPDEPVDSLGKHLTKNDARSPRAVSTPLLVFVLTRCVPPFPRRHIRTLVNVVCVAGTAEFTTSFILVSSLFFLNFRSVCLSIRASLFLLLFYVCVFSSSHLLVCQSF